jgi:hypothetical protein
MKTLAIILIGVILLYCAVSLAAWFSFRLNLSKKR